MWTRKRLDPDHFAILWDGLTVGSVHLASYLPKHRLDRWAWSAMTRPGGHGYFPSIEAAQEAVRQAVLRDGVATLPPPPPPRIVFVQTVDVRDQVEW